MSDRIEEKWAAMPEEERERVAARLKELCAPARWLTPADDPRWRDDPLWVAAWGTHAKVSMRATYGVAPVLADNRFAPVSMGPDYLVGTDGAIFIELAPPPRYDECWHWGFPDWVARYLRRQSIRDLAALRLTRPAFAVRVPPVDVEIAEESIEVQPEKLCPDCLGDGMVKWTPGEHDGEEYEYEDRCRRCDRSGMVPAPDLPPVPASSPLRSEWGRVVKVGAQYVRLGYMRLISRLPNPVICEAEVRGGTKPPLWFAFGDETSAVRGRGAVMPTIDVDEATEVAGGYRLGWAVPCPETLLSEASPAAVKGGAA